MGLANPLRYLSNVVYLSTPLTIRKATIQYISAKFSLATAQFAQLRAWILQHKAFIRLSPIAINTLALRP